MPEEKIIDANKHEEYVLYAESARKLNRVRDIGLYLVFLCLIVVSIIFWIDMNNAKTFYKEQSEAQAAALKKFEEQVNDLSSKREKAYIQSALEQVIRENKTTREMIYKAWTDHDAKLKRLTESVEKLSKKK